MYNGNKGSSCGVVSSITDVMNGARVAACCKNIRSRSSCEEVCHSNHECAAGYFDYLASKCHISFQKKISEQGTLSEWKIMPIFCAR